ncbi:MAG: M12 family metallopeptidase [Chloroflexota bacterium]
MVESTSSTEENFLELSPYTCIDRVLPDELRKLADQVAREEKGISYLDRGALEVNKRWKVGRTLRVYFMDGDPQIHRKVEAIFPEWSKYANIQFQVTNDSSSEIRISFQQTGSWSYIGTDALLVPRRKPTMNYGWLQPTTSESEMLRVVLHEFGHALGLIHEHQNPMVNIPWDKEAVYRYYSGPPNYWSRAQTDRNLFLAYSKENTQYTQFDADSIMLYPVENRFTTNDFEIGWNKTLSELDKKFIAEQYPYETRAKNEIVVDGEAIEGAIEEHGEVDDYIFPVKMSGGYTIETVGKTDVSLALYGPDDKTRLIAEDDDSGRGLNAKISKVLRSGEYTLKVRHFSKSQGGAYKIKVTRND